jgi:hypothetical protein
VLRILVRVAHGVHNDENAAEEAVRPDAVGHILRVLRIKKAHLEGLKDKSKTNVRRLMLATIGGAL